jgi:hypothetical protein
VKRKRGERKKEEKRKGIRVKIYKRNVKRKG